MGRKLPLLEEPPQPSLPAWELWPRVSVCRPEELRAQPYPAVCVCGWVSAASGNECVGRHERSGPGSSLTSARAGWCLLFDLEPGANLHCFLPLRLGTLVQHSPQGSYLASLLAILLLWPSAYIHIPINRDTFSGQLPGPACTDLALKTEAAVCIIPGRGADLEEQIRRKQEEEQAWTAPSAHWLPMETLVFGVMFPEGLPGGSLSPLAGSLSPLAGEGRSSGTQHAGTAHTEDAACHPKDPPVTSLLRQVTPFSASGLVLGLLLLCMAAMASCPEEYKVVHQLRQQAKIMTNTSMLLDPYIRIQGLNMVHSKDKCKEHLESFPSLDTLQKLSRVGFLQTLHAILGRVLHRLPAQQPKMPLVTQDDLDRKKLYYTKQFIQGAKNNIFCLVVRLLNDSSELALPTQVNLGTSTSPTPSLGFQHKLDGCRFLQGYHHFMQSVEQIFGKWEEGLNRSRSRSRSRRHSPLLALQGQARRKRPSRKAKRPVSRGLLPW
ncbi:PREDICTED: uncharacterized protein LOC102832536 [Chrysochloris asiatica]|uniref:Uncharacterized protein LOC102832536 n=1 Tax=Chrysochloris asiatica TaxID=185453 RepID=A0A9B0TS16_CHRAS|nr:PREDICTED: uncharacterized protein LOC102832536 [Chrysochloris asiatica]